MLTTLLAYAALAVAPAPESIDASAYADELRALTDGAGHYLMFHLNTNQTVEDLFYGDGVTMYRVTVTMSSGDGDKAELRIGDPRLAWNKRPEVTTPDRWATGTVSCASRKTNLTALPKNEAKALAHKAVFKRQPYAFQPYSLARDDEGVYYYVDKGRFDDNEKVFNVYIGPRGAMKQQKLTNIVHDSGGDMFSTSSGQLRLIVGNKAEWVNGAKHNALTELAVKDNTQMIFNDLGMYKNLRLGQPCDDL